ncbi:MAG TPA: BMP family ABC transporter substrate-binding protein [Gaiellaceae bacterium]|nr:BMP family ABC transporter substrate-binding protein [Gaiellaceae bacterium]
MLAGVAVLATMVLAIAVGTGAAATKPVSAHAAPAAHALASVAPKVGLVTDIGGLNDHGFNHLAYLGLQEAASKLGVQTRVLESHSNADYIPNMSTLAQQGYNLVICVGFLMDSSVITVAKKFPNVKFMIIDNGWSKGNPPNLEGTLFHEQEAGYLVGYLSGLLYKNKAVTMSTVGGQKIPPVDRYIAGFQAGAKAADPQVTLLNGYSQDFVAQDKCKNLALQQISQGSKVVFQVAGGCGLGALDAAKQKHVWGIGVDADQSYIGAQVLTSALKRVDTDVFTTIKQLRNGIWKGGRTFTFTVANGGIDIGTVSPKVPKSIVAQVQAVKAKIKAGKVHIPVTVP